MSSVLETLSLNELKIRKEHLLKQLQKVEFYIENEISKNIIEEKITQLITKKSTFIGEKTVESNILENNFLININDQTNIKNDQTNIKKVKIKINIKKI